MLHHELERWAVIRVCAGKTVVNVGAVVDPVGIVFDEGLVVGPLELDGYDLVNIIGRNTAVCSNTKLRPGCARVAVAAIFWTFRPL